MNPLESDRIRLRETNEEDLAPLAVWYQDPAVARFQSFGPLHPRPIAAAIEMGRAWAGNKGTDVALVVVTKAENMVIGQIGLWGADAHNRTATFAIMIGPPHQGQGYGLETTRLVLAYGFDELGLHRIQLDVNGTNERAIKTYRQAGFVEEGRSREAVFREGAWQDKVQMGILEREWRSAH